MDSFTPNESVVSTVLQEVSNGDISKEVADNIATGVDKALGAKGLVKSVDNMIEAGLQQNTAGLAAEATMTGAGVINSNFDDKVELTPVERE